MRRFLTAGLLLLVVSAAEGQIKYNPPGGSGGGVEDPGSNGMMARTALDTTTARSIAAGDGIVVSNGTGESGDPTISIDGATVPFKGSGADDPPAACGDTGDDYALLDFYLETDTQEAYACVAVDTWAIVTSSGTSFDPGTTVDFYEEFWGGNIGISATGAVGQQGLTSLAIGSGSGNAVAALAGNENNPAMISLTTGTTDNTGQYLIVSNQAPSIVNATWANKTWSMDGVVCLGITGDLTSNALWFGLSSGASSLLTASSGVWITRDTDLSHAAFVAAICDSATTGCQEAGDATNQESALSSITPSDDTCYRLRISHDPTGGPSSSRKVSMRVNDETPLTFCSSGCTDTVAQFPSGTMVPIFAVVARAGSASRAHAIDYLHIKIEGLSRY